MIKKAIVLGNGKSRLGKEIPKGYTVYACNLAYKEDIDIDVLVATDANRQHEIYCSGYANTHRCVFLDWMPIPSEDFGPEFLISTGALIKQNEYTDHGLVVSGYGNTMFFTYLNESDCVENMPMSYLTKRYSAGSTAMWLAAREGHTEILLAGFNDDKHAYREYAGGLDVPHTELWKWERERLINEYDDVTWRYI